jgi:hypothetical protein
MQCFGEPVNFRFYVCDIFCKDRSTIGGILEYRLMKQYVFLVLSYLVVSDKLNAPIFLASRKQLLVPFGHECNCVLDSLDVLGMRKFLCLRRELNSNSSTRVSVI